MKIRALHEEALATIERLQGIHPDLKQLFEKSYGYAVFPSVGRASVAVGVSFGRGGVFERGQPIGGATITELTLGVQVGGQTFSELMFFPTQHTIGIQLGGDTFIELVILDEPETVRRFKEGKVAFAANAAAVIVKAGVAATRSSPPGADVQIVTEGGLLLETALGGQKFVFRPAVLTRGRRLKLEPVA